MPHVSRKLQLSASEQLRRLLGEPWPFSGRLPKHGLSAWTVTDDWSGRIPVTDAEVDEFETWFGDALSGPAPAAGLGCG